MKANARVPDPRAEQPEGLAANEAGCGEFHCGAPPVRRKIALNSPGIQGMLAKDLLSPNVQHGKGEPKRYTHRTERRLQYFQSGRHPP
jgi:hypothetical protein